MTSLFTYRDDHCPCVECHAYRMGRDAGYRRTLWAMAVGAAWDEATWADTALRCTMRTDHSFATACVMQYRSLSEKRAALRALADLGDEQAIKLMEGGV